MERRKKLIEEYHYFLREIDELKKEAIGNQSKKLVKFEQKLDQIRLELNNGKVCGEFIPLDIWF